MRRKISLFIRYNSRASDEITSRLVTIDISEIPIAIRKKYLDNYDLEYLVKWYIYTHYLESNIVILNISVLNALHDFIVESV